MTSCQTGTVTHIGPFSLHICMTPPTHYWVTPIQVWANTVTTFCGWWNIYMRLKKSTSVVNIYRFTAHGKSTVGEQVYGLFGAACIMSTLQFSHHYIVEQVSLREWQKTPRPRAHSRLLLVVIQHCSLLTAHCSLLTALFTVKLESAPRCLLTIVVLHLILHVKCLAQGWEPLICLGYRDVQ